MLSWSNSPSKSFSNSIPQSKGLVCRDLGLSRANSPVSFQCLYAHLISIFSRISLPHSGCCPPVQRPYFIFSGQLLSWGRAVTCCVELGKGLFYSVFFITASILNPTNQFQRYLGIPVPNILRLPHCKLGLFSVSPTIGFAFWFLKSARQLSLFHWISIYKMLFSPLQFSLSLLVFF